MTLSPEGLASTPPAVRRSQLLGLEYNRVSRHECCRNLREQNAFTQLMTPPRLCLHRIVLTRRERPIAFALPELRAARAAGPAVTVIPSRSCFGECLFGRGRRAGEVSRGIRSSSAESRRPFERQQRLDTSSRCSISAARRTEEALPFAASDRGSLARRQRRQSVIMRRL